MASRSLDRMVPVVAEKAERLVEAMSGEVLIYCTARHESEQAALWRHGRPGWLIRHRMRQLYDRAEALERGTQLPTDREVALAKASADCLRKFGTEAFQPKRPKTKLPLAGSRIRLARPEILSPSVSSGSAAANMSLG